MNVAADEETGATNTKTFEIPVSYTVVDEKTVRMLSWKAIHLLKRLSRMLM